MLSGIAVLMVAVPHVEILAVRLFTVGLCFNVFIRWHQAVVQEVGVRCDRVSLGVESCKIVFLGSISYSLVHFCCSIVLFSQSTLRHRQTDGQTDIQTGRRQYHAKGRSYCVQQYDRLKRTAIFWSRNKKHIVAEQNAFHTVQSTLFGKRQRSIDRCH